MSGRCRFNVISENGRYMRLCKRNGAFKDESKLDDGSINPDLCFCKQHWGIYLRDLEFEKLMISIKVERAINTYRANFSAVLDELVKEIGVLGGEYREKVAAEGSAVATC